jgi:hypothetical protein
VNDQGELGDGTRDSRFSADVPVRGIDDAVSVAAGIRFSCAVRSSGTTWCWGEDLGSDDIGTLPSQVPGVVDAVAVTAGGAHACVLRRGGQVACWGGGSLGQLGSGEFDFGSGVALPRAVVGINNAVQISAGWNHTCARTADGSLWCWGGNGDGATGYGQLGDGTFENRASPVRVLGIDNAVDVAAGGWTTCAVLRDDTVWCWGYGERGGLGNGARGNSATPVQVLGLTNGQHVAAGRFHACAQRSGGAVACWGDVGWAGGNSTDVPVDGAANASSVLLSTDRSLLLVTGGGQLREWGLNSDNGPQVVVVGP